MKRAARIGDTEFSSWALYGESDEFGFKAAVNARSVHCVDATLLHLMGLDHEWFKFYHNGLERRLKNVMAKPLATRVVQDYLWSWCSRELVQVRDAIRTIAEMAERISLGSCGHKPRTVARATAFPFEC